MRWIGRSRCGGLGGHDGWNAQLATDGNVSALWNPCLNPYELPPLTDEEQAELFRVGLLGFDGLLQGMAAELGDPPIVRADGARVLYFYGPIDRYDLEVNLDALRDFVSALNFIIPLVRSTSRQYATRIRDKSPVWRFLDAHQIGTSAFARAVQKHQDVELHAIEMARSRYRKQQAGEHTQASAKRSQPKKAPARPKRTQPRQHEHAAKGIRAHRRKAPIR